MKVPSFVFLVLILYILGGSFFFSLLDLVLCSTIPYTSLQIQQPTAEDFLEPNVIT